MQVSPQLLKQVTENYSRDRMRSRDLNRRGDNLSHYRSEPSKHEAVFTRRHYEFFRDITGDLLELLGYESK